MSDELQLGTVEIVVHPEWCEEPKGLGHTCVGTESDKIGQAGCRFCLADGKKRPLTGRPFGIRRPKWCPARLEFDRERG